MSDADRIESALAKISIIAGHSVVPCTVERVAETPKRPRDLGCYVEQSATGILVHVVSEDGKAGRMLCRAVESVLQPFSPSKPATHGNCVTYQIKPPAKKETSHAATDAKKGLGRKG